MRGRGDQKLPEHLKQFLLDYARMFEDELTGDDIRYLVRLIAIAGPRAAVAGSSG